MTTKGYKRLPFLSLPFPFLDWVFLPSETLALPVIVTEAVRAAASDTAQGQIAGPPAQPYFTNNEDPSASPPSCLGPPLVGWEWAVK